jgi:hypothetical protein
MAESAMFIGFGVPVRGRERQAINVYQEALEYYARLSESGEVSGFEPVFLEAHGGRLNGFFLVRGDEESLRRIGASDEFARLNIRAGIVTEDVVVTGAALGDQIAVRMSIYGDQLEELT